MKMKFKLWEWVAVWTIVVVGICFAVHEARTADVEKPVFAGPPEIAYHAPYVGEKVAIGGEIKGIGRQKLAASGGNQYARWLDVATPNNKAAKGVRCYYGSELLRKGADVVAEGVITQEGRLRITRITFVVDDPAR